MPRQIIVAAHPKNFRITVPDGAKVTFGPWSPSTESAKYGATDKALNGTLRVYETAKPSATLLGVFSGVTGFREEGLSYEQEEIVLEGAKVWKSDSKGYSHEESVARKSNWDQLASGETPSEDEPEV